MKSVLLFTFFIFFTVKVYSQIIPQNGMTEILKTDDYSNFKTPKQAVFYNGTFSISSGILNDGAAHLSKKKDFTTV